MTWKASFTFDAPISHSSSAYDKANRKQANAYALPVAKPKPKDPEIKESPAFLSKLKHQARKSFGSSSTSSSTASTSKKGKRTTPRPPPTPFKQSLFFLLLPLAIRQKIYGILFGQNELLHILLRYRSRPSRWKVAYRRCSAGGNVDYCVLKNCREFHDVVKGSYYGYFDHVGSIFHVCRDMYAEAAQVLYTTNIFEFDHPLSLILLKREISPDVLNSIRFLSVDLQRYIYVYSEENFGSCTSLRPEQWWEMWEVIAGMKELEEIRVRFQLLVDGWMGWSEREVLEPLKLVKRGKEEGLKVFEVEMPMSDKGELGAGDVGGGDEDTPFTLVRC